MKQNKFNKLLKNIICGFIPSPGLRDIIRDGYFKQYIQNYSVVKKDLKLEKSRTFKHNLCFVAIVKNEGHYIQEWIEYHRIVGVEKFYIYDNESTDNTKKILEPYIKNGIVEYTYWVGKAQQKPVYNDALFKHKYDTKWLGFIDIDEFVLPIQNNNILEVLKNYENYAGLSMHWVIFGDSHKQTRNIKTPVIEDFTYRASNDFKRNQEIKTIVNPRFIIGMSAHKPYVFKSYYSVDENYNKIHSHKNNPFSANKIRINHYFGKTYEEFLIKKNRGRTLSGGGYSDSGFEYNNKNDILDTIIFKFLPKLKDNLKCKK